MFIDLHESWPAAPKARLSDVFENKVGAIRVDRADSREIATRAKELYEARWRAGLERDPLLEFAAMEPESATYFLGQSFRDAIRSARHAPPDRLTFMLRIVHDCAVEMVGMWIERAVSAGVRTHGERCAGSLMVKLGEDQEAVVIAERLYNTRRSQLEG